MKRSIFLFLPFCLGLLLASCSKQTEGPKDDGAHFFSCALDGEVFRAEGLNAYAVDWDDSYNVYGIDLDEITIYVAVDQSISEGTHAFNGETTFAIVSKQNGKSYSTLLEGGEGQVSIEERTATSVRGTFQFKAVDFEDYDTLLEVKEGKFRVQFR